MTVESEDKAVVYLGRFLFSMLFIAILWMGFDISYFFWKIKNTNSIVQKPPNTEVWSQFINVYQEHMSYVQKEVDKDKKIIDDLIGKEKIIEKQEEITSSPKKKIVIYGKK